MTRPRIKCVVWDLDHTVWNGILLEGDALALREGVLETLRILDERGILLSIASRNDPAAALDQLRKFSIDHLFLHPQIGWDPKSESLRAIAQRLNIGLDTFAFIDDQVFERDEVAFALPEVRVYDANQAAALPALPEFMPARITEDARNRRRMYQDDLRREVAQKTFQGPNEAFLATLDMALTLAPAEPADLGRVEELVSRTNQLNTTGRQYDLAELEALRTSPRHRLLVVELTDRYGSYGKIGVVLLECTEAVWQIRLLLMSCRVMNRGVGGAVITWLRGQAKAAGVRLLADFRATDKNRMMYVTYRFAGFSEIGEEDGVSQLEADLQNVPALPRYLRVEATLGDRCHA